MFNLLTKMIVQLKNIKLDADCNSICANSGMTTVGGNNFQMPPPPVFTPQPPVQQICSCYPVGGGGNGFNNPPPPGFYPPPPSYPPPSYYPPTQQYPPSPPKKSNKIECNTSTYVLCDQVVEDVPQTSTPPPTPPPSNQVPPPPMYPPPPVYAPPPVYLPPPVYAPPPQPSYGTGSPSMPPQQSVPTYTSPSGNKQMVSSDCVSECTSGGSQTKQVKIQKQPTQVIVEAAPPTTTSSDSCMCAPSSGSISGGGIQFMGTSGSAEVCVQKEQSNIQNDCLTNGGMDFQRIGTVEIPKLSTDPVSTNTSYCSC